MTAADAQRLGEILGSFTGVGAVYLFGSAAEDRERPNSDVDVAVVPHDAAVRARRVEMLTELARAGFDRVDLVCLDGTDAVLRFHAVRRNRLLFRAPGFDHPGYFARALREYFDLEPLLRARHAAYRRRVLGG
ncbi:MAG: nucleotidyltransferase domain-containing protein [Candidatus Latescibacterota bacterium]